MEEAAKISGNNVKSITSLFRFILQRCRCLDFVVSNDSMADELGRIWKEVVET
jgi:hypothetical protein